MMVAVFGGGIVLSIDDGSPMRCTRRRLNGGTDGFGGI